VSPRLRGALAGSALALLTGCTTHVLGDLDLAAARDDAELAGRIYRDMDALDAGRDRAYARGIYCDETDKLRRSGAALSPDAAVIPCDVAK
jgi:hypothetical protein